MSEIAHWCLTVCNPTDCSLPRSSIHEILQARILEWVAISCSRASSQVSNPRLFVSCIGRWFFTSSCTTWEVPMYMGY